MTGSAALSVPGERSVGLLGDEGQDRLDQLGTVWKVAVERYPSDTRGRSDVGHRRVRIARETGPCGLQDRRHISTGVARWGRGVDLYRPGRSASPSVPLKSDYIVQFRIVDNQDLRLATRSRLALMGSVRVNSCGHDGVNVATSARPTPGIAPHGGAAREGDTLVPEWLSSHVLGQQAPRRTASSVARPRCVRHVGLVWRVRAGSPTSPSTQPGIEVYCCVVPTPTRAESSAGPNDASPIASLVTNAPGMAIDSRGPTAGTLIHSDQGVQSHPGP